jgi:LacI family transcriptional regulator
MKKRPHVALLIETSNAYARGLLRGIRRYLSEGRAWSIFLPEQGRGDAPGSWLADWKGDGIIARIENRRIATAVERTGLPAVDVSAGRLVPALPMVETDNEAIARLALEHFTERGFRELAFCGDERFAWAKARGTFFTRLAAEAGCACRVFPPPGAPARMSPETEQTQLAAWIRGLPKPAGVMACYDIRGWQLLETCRRIGVAVPDEVSVLGVDNDELLCDLSEPPLSSVVPDTDRTGYEAAALLDRMLAGKSVPAAEHLIPPLGIVTRRSSDALAIADEDVSQALRLIREHACDGIKVPDVLARLAVSRRVLESRFKKLVGRTPHEEIVRLQMERVTRLLLETDLPLATIAERAGFQHVEYLSAAFKQRTGQSPSQFRRAKRGR